MLDPLGASPIAGAPAPDGIDLDAYRRDPQSAFKAMLHVLPFSLAVRETMRMRALADRGRLATPLLDVGCGDGLFWELITRTAQGPQPALNGLLGIDINPTELQLASMRLKSRGAAVEVLDISTNLEEQPLQDLAGSFRTVIANCSLEHVQHLEGALSNIHRYLVEGGEFLLFVPAPGWTDTLAMKQVTRRLNARMAGALGGVLDGFFQHHHLYPEFVWRHLLRGAGFRDVSTVGLGSRRASALFERHLGSALLSFVVKSARGKYLRNNPEAIFTSSGAFRDFMTEIAEGGFIHQDLGADHVVEYFIRCVK